MLGRCTEQALFTWRERARARAAATLACVGSGHRQELERWAAALARSDVGELRAAGRAIAALCAENEALEQRLARLEPQPPDEDGGDASAGVPAPRLPHARPRGPRRRARRQLPWRRIAVAGLGVVLVAGVLALAARAAAPDLDVSGPDGSARVGRAALPKLKVVADATDAEWRLDGRTVTPRVEGRRAIWRPGELGEGLHELVVRRTGPLFASTTRTFRFVVDTKAPVLAFDGPAVLVARKPLVLAGTAEPGARLRQGSRVAAVDARGRFRFELPGASHQVRLAATDLAGNTSLWRVPITVVPRRPVERIRSVHVTAYAWADDDLRAGIMELVRSRRINAVQLDLKDESGEVGWASGVPLAKQIGAQLEIYDLPAALNALHSVGVRVIGRIVCFRDPIHAQAAWNAGRRAEVVQAPDGSPYSKYGGFTNFAHPAVRKYNIDLAVAAARLGVDEILYDYVRRPDGPPASMAFPRMRGTPEASIASFLAESRSALSTTDALLGASVFGVAATRPEEVAQDIPAMARHVDYIAPMLYPSHWGAGEYDVADPNGQPYDIVRRSTADFVKQVRGTGARIVNWLQDFSYGRTYGPAEVRAQIEGSRDAGVDEFILWDAAVTYTADGLATSAGVPALEVTEAPPKDAPMPVRLQDPAPAASKPPARVADPQETTQPRTGLPANELGQIPVVMHHMIRADRVGEYDQTPAEFRAELEYLWKNGYVPVNVGDLISGELDVPKGTTPVAFTFDDATTYQIAFTPEGAIEPSTAVGIMLEFARTHPGFVPRGTFYVNRTPFGSQRAAKQALPWLHENGFEIGNHTHSHVPLRTLPDEEVRRQLWTGEALIRELLPDYQVTSMSLPLGSLPRNPKLAVAGTWQGQRYGPYGVLLVGANPAPSPYSKRFDSEGIPRIRTSHAGWDGEPDFSFWYWMKELERSPASRFVSDGDPRTLTVPKGVENEVRPRFVARLRARP